MSPKTEKTRLDVLLVERGLAPSRERAQAILLAGNVRVNGKRVDKPGVRLASDARIELAGEGLRYSSRGGLKLEGALEDFGITARDKTCLDVGSSTEDSRTVCSNKVRAESMPWMSPSISSIGSYRRTRE